MAHACSGCARFREPTRPGGSYRAQQFVGRKRGGKMVGMDMSKMLAARVAARDRVYKAAGEVPQRPAQMYWGWGEGK